MVSNFQAKNYKDKLLEAGMTTLEQRRGRGDLIRMYRIMTGKDDVHFSTWLQRMSDGEGGANTRAAAGYLNVLPPDNCSNNTRRYFFSQRVVDSWNNLPDSGKQAESVNLFINCLDDHLQAFGGHPTRMFPAQ
jgi:ribonuclease P/MRP protein subunit RPP40